MISARQQSANRHNETAVTYNLPVCMCQSASHTPDLPFLDESIYARLRDRVMETPIRAMIRPTYQSVVALGWTGNQSDWHALDVPAPQGRISQ